MKYSIKGFVLAIVAVAFTACGSSQEELESAVAPAGDSAIILTAEQVKNGGITFGKIERKLLSFDIRAKGKITLPPGYLASVGCVTGGVIESVLVSPGSHVNKGTALASIASPEIIALQQDYASAANRLKQLEAEFKRQKELKREGITSEKVFLEAESAFNGVMIEKEALEAKLGMLHIEPGDILKGKIRRAAVVASPLDGYVEQVNAHLGQYAEPNSVLFQVVNTSRMNIELMVFEKDIRFIAAGQRVTFELSGMSGDTFEAQVSTIGQTVADDARTVRAIATLVSPPEALLPGMFVSAEIHTDEQELDALPEESVVADHDGSYCFYMLPSTSRQEMRFFRLPVSTGFKEDGFIQVTPLTPLPANAEIVTSGTYFIRAEALKQTE